MKEDEDIYVAVVECIRLMALIHLLWWNKLIRHTHEWRHHDYYNVVLRWLPSTSIYVMHEGVGGCEEVIEAADLPSTKLLLV